MLSIEKFPQVPFAFSLRRIIRLSMPALLVAATIAPAFGQQQKLAPNPVRITQAIDDAAITTLKGNIHPLARPQNDLGAAPVSQPMYHLQLVLQRSPAQEAALQGYLAEVQVKSSPNYHKWLTPQQFGQLYGPNDADIQTITTWLTNHGFTVNKVANGRTFIDFSGSVAQVQDAFHTSIHSYRANGLSFYANATNPSIPTAIAPVVSGVTHLNNIPLKPALVHGKFAKFDSQTNRFTPVGSTSKPHAEYTVGDSENGFYLFAVPADAATIYDTPNQTLNAKFSGTTSYTGTGATIGIMGQSSIMTSLVQNYRNLFVGDTKAPIVTNIDDVGDSPGDDDESYLDNEIAGGLAPGANIHFYTASATTDNGVLTSAQYAIDTDNTIDILSLSYGACELDNTTAGNQAISALWQQAAAQGITVVVAAGDNGSAGCDATQDSEGNNIPAASGPIAVNGLASTPYDIAVGGTDYDVLAIGTFGNYVSTGSPGSASSYYRTALGYIPEDSWNNSTYNNTTIDQNVYVGYVSGNPSDDNISAGSGGPSNCATNTTTDEAIGTCTAGYPKPSWQTGAGVPNDQVRDIPDVSFLAGNGFYSALWAVCDGSTNGNDSAGNTGVANCVADSTGDFYTDGFGGTSAATPVFAGMMAMVVQKTGQRQGQAAPILYSLYNSNASIFHDITTGNNSVPCSPSTYNTNTCEENSQGFDYMNGFNTNAGYDLATGLGSVDATLMVNNWTSASGSLFVATVAATPSATSITTAQPLSFTVNVTPLATGGSTPAGSVTAADSVTGYTSSAVALVNGSATITIPANTLQASTADTFTIAYAPTGTTFAPASDFVTVAITQAATPSLTVSGPSIAIAPPGGSGTSMITVTPGGGFTGAVALTCAVTGPAGATSLPTCSLSPASVTIAGTTAQTSTLAVATTATTTAGTYTATVTATGTGSVVGTAPISVTVASTTTPTLTVSGPAITITLPSQTTGSSVVTVTPGGGFTGAVNLTCTVTAPTGATSPPTCAFSSPSVSISGTTAGTSTLNVTASSTTTVGAYTVNVTATAASGSPTASDGIALTIGGTAASDTITLGAPSAATVSSPGGSGTSTFTVTTNYSPATINFTCTLASSPSGANASYYPGCSVPAVTASSASTAVNATATFTTTAATSELTYPQTNRKPGSHWYTAAGGAAVACVLFFGIPAKRRTWKSMLVLLVFLVTMAGVGCGGGSSGGGGTVGTTTGTYTFTVTGTDSSNSSTVSAAQTITLTVN
jgi:hypothetical protein